MSKMLNARVITISEIKNEYYLFNKDKYLYFIYIYKFIVLILSCKCIYAFDYSNQNPNYIAKQSIEVNIPILESTTGIWSVEPQFSKGLILNNDGTITGIPIEEYHNTYVVLFTPEGSTEVQRSTLIITIWEKPTSFSYGVEIISSFSSFDLTLSPKTDHRITSYSFDGNDIPSEISLNNETGVLVFSNYDASNIKYNYIYLVLQ